MKVELLPKGRRGEERREDGGCIRVVKPIICWVKYPFRIKKREG